MNKILKATLILGLGFVSNGYAKNPASTAYITEAVQVARAEIQAMIDSVILGVPGPKGAAGAAGPMGNQGAPGDAGVPIAAGGAAGNMLVKASDGNYDTEWKGAPKSYQVGEQVMGGVVFWVDDTGQHGLISSIGDNLTGGDLANNAGEITGARYDGLFAGRLNTLLSIYRYKYINAPSFTALAVCMGYSKQEDGVTACTGADGEICYDGWYLPSFVELVNLWYQGNTGPLGAGAPVQGFVGGNVNYWSSNESVTTGQTYTLDFTTGLRGNRPNTEGHRARCIRAF